MLRVLEALRLVLRSNVDCLSRRRAAFKDRKWIAGQWQSTCDVFTMATFIASSRDAHVDVKRLLEVVKIFRHLSTKAPAMLTAKSVVAVAEVAAALLDHVAKHHGAPEHRRRAARAAAETVAAVGAHWRTATAVVLSGPGDVFAPLFARADVRRDILRVHGADAARTECRGGADCLTVAFGGIWDGVWTGAGGACCCCFPPAGRLRRRRRGAASGGRSVLRAVLPRSPRRRAAACGDGAELGGGGARPRAGGGAARRPSRCDQGDDDDDARGDRALAAARGGGGARRSARDVDRRPPWRDHLDEDDDVCAAAAADAEQPLALSSLRRLPYFLLPLDLYEGLGF